MKALIKSSAPLREKRTTIKEWANVIQQHLCESVNKIVYAGHELEAAVAHFKEYPPEGMSNWKHAYGELLRQIGISNASAIKLRQIANHPILGKAVHAYCLPARWTTLAALATLPEIEVQKRIKSGEITPELKGSEVREWKSNPSKWKGCSVKKTTESSLDIAHDVFLELPRKKFIIEVLNLISDHRSGLSLDDLIKTQEDL